MDLHPASEGKPGRVGALEAQPNRTDHWGVMDMTYRVFTVHVESDMTDEDAHEAMRRAAEFMAEDMDQLHALEVAENGVSFSHYEFDVDDELAIIAGGE